MPLLGRVPLLLMLAIITTEFATGIFLPSLPLIGSHFGVSDEAIVPIVSLNLLGIALSGPLYGPLSDSFGRRAILLVGMSLFVAGSLLCLYHDSLPFLMLSRFIQGLGEGVAAVVGLATVKDLFDDRECAQVYGVMDMGIVLVPAIAPIIGGLLSELYGWHINFYFIMAMSLGTWVLLFKFLPETHEKEYRHPFSIRNLSKTYIHLATNLTFIGNAVVSGLVFGGLWVFITGAPYLFVNEFGISVMDYSFYSILGVFSYIVGSILNTVMVKDSGIQALLAFGLYMMMLAAFLLIFIAIYYPTSPLLIALGAACYTGPMALVFVNTGTRALEAYPDFSGFSAALLLSIEMAISSISTQLTSIFYEDNFMPLAVLMFVHAFLSLTIFFILEYVKRMRQKT